MNSPDPLPLDLGSGVRGPSSGGAATGGGGGGGGGGSADTAQGSDTCLLETEWTRLPPDLRASLYAACKPASIDATRAWLPTSCVRGRWPPQPLSRTRQRFSRRRSPSAAH